MVLEASCPLCAVFRNHLHESQFVAANPLSCQSCLGAPENKMGRWCLNQWAVAVGVAVSLLGSPVRAISAAVPSPDLIEMPKTFMVEFLDDYVSLYSWVSRRYWQESLF